MKSIATEIINKYGQEALHGLFMQHTQEELAKMWACHIATVHRVAKLSSFVSRITPADICNQYSKDALISMYDALKSVKRVADSIGCDPGTITKVFKSLGISFKKFPKVNKCLSDTTKESLEKELSNHSIKEVADLHGVHPGQVLARMSELNILRNQKQPHRRNRSMLSIPDDIFKELIEYRGVLDAARELNCSQSAIRDRANRLGIGLVAGPRKALTSTEAWQSMVRQNGLNTNIMLGKKGFKNTSIEIATQAYLRSKGVKFELHPKILNLTVPDAFVAPNICIYVDGCYWHGCPTCKVSDKNSGLKYTKTHDNFVNAQLTKAGYTIVRIWEHDIKAGNFSQLSFLFNSF